MLFIPCHDIKRDNNSISCCKLCLICSSFRTEVNLFPIVLANAPSKKRPSCSNLISMSASFHIGLKGFSFGLQNSWYHGIVSFILWCGPLGLLASRIGHLVALRTERMTLKGGLTPTRGDQFGGLEVFHLEKGTHAGTPCHLRLSISFDLYVYRALIWSVSGITVDGRNIILSMMHLAAAERAQEQGRLPSCRSCFVNAK